MLGQLFTVRDTISLLLDLAAGTLDIRFYASIVEIGVVFPLSLWLLFTVMDTDRFHEVAVNAYAFALSLVAAVYYLAISGNYPELIASLARAMPRTDAPVRHLILFGLFALPLLGTLLFANRAGRDVAGVAAVPLLATFLYGTIQIIGQLKTGQIGAAFAAVAVPRILMATILFLAGLQLFARFAPRRNDEDSYRFEGTADRWRRTQRY